MSRLHEDHDGNLFRWASDVGRLGAIPTIRWQDRESIPYRHGYANHEGKFDPAVKERMDRELKQLLKEAAEDRAKYIMEKMNKS